MVVSYSAVENQYSVLGREQQWKICWWEGGNGESRRERDGYRSDYESSDDQSMVHCPLVSLNYQSSIKLKSVISRCLQQLVHNIWAVIGGLISLSRIWSSTGVVEFIRSVSHCSGYVLILICKELAGRTDSSPQICSKHWLEALQANVKVWEFYSNSFGNRWRFLSRGELWSDLLCWFNPPGSYKYSREDNKEVKKVVT